MLVPKRAAAKPRRRTALGAAGRAHIALQCSRWEPERPVAKSLWLLPSGPDQVGDDHVRPTPAAHMAGPGGGFKRLPTRADLAALAPFLSVPPLGRAHLL